MTRAFNPLTGEVRIFQPGEIIPSTWIQISMPEPIGSQVGTELCYWIEGTCYSPPLISVNVTKINWIPWAILLGVVFGVVIYTGH